MTFDERLGPIEPEAAVQTAAAVEEQGRAARLEEKKIRSRDTLAFLARPLYSGCALAL